MTDETLAQLFSEAGVVKSAKTQLKPDGFPRGWGWVNMLYFISRKQLNGFPYNAILDVSTESLNSILLKKHNVPSSYSTAEHRLMAPH